jgi:hypothetical protein
MGAKSTPDRCVGGVRVGEVRREQVGEAQVRVAHVRAGHSPRLDRDRVQPTCCRHHNKMLRQEMDTFSAAPYDCSWQVWLNPAENYRIRKSETIAADLRSSLLALSGNL